MGEKMMGNFVIGFAIGAGVAVSFGWYGLATTLGLSALLLEIQNAMAYIGRLVGLSVIRAEK